MIKEDTFFIEVTNLAGYKKLEESNNITLMIGSKSLGNADKQLGEYLLMEYLVSLKNSYILPKNIILYNEGVLLSQENSPFFNILYEFQKLGVNIFVCKVSLRYYGYARTRFVGDLIDMREIIEKQMSASKLITI